MSRRPISSAILLLLILTALPFLCDCGGYDEALLLGVLGPETGDYSAYGLAGFRGAALAIKAVAKREHTSEELKYQIIHYDGGEDLAVLESQFRRLVEVDGVSAVVFTDPRPEAIRLAGRLSAELDVATLLVADTLDTSAELDSPNLYNLTVPVSEMIPRIVEVADEWAGMDKVALVNATPSLYGFYRQLYLDELERREGLSYTEINISFTEHDYDSAAYQLLARNYDGVIVNGDIECLVELLNACAELTYHPTFVAPISAKPLRLELPELNVLDNGYFVGGFCVTDERAETISFSEHYRAHVGYRPGPVAVAAYDAALFALQGIREADDGASDRVAGALATLESYSGILGEYDLSAAPSRIYVEATVPAATGVTTELMDEAPIEAVIEELLGEDSEQEVDNQDYTAVVDPSALTLSPEDIESTEEADTDD